MELYLWHVTHVKLFLVFVIMRMCLSNFVPENVKVVDLDNNQERLIRRLEKHGKKYRNNLMLKRIHKARRRNATCMDGSDARYYLSRQWESSNWVIHLQGGGSCVSQEDCRKRSQSALGSSVSLDERLTGEWTLSNDPNINPTFYKWNKVFITYCSGDVFVGRKLRKHHPYRMPMLGHYIFKAIIEDLVRLHKINKKGTKILFGGTSAGGVGVIANADLLQKMTYPAEVKAYNDGGWFTLFPNFGESLSNELPKFFIMFSVLFDQYWDGYVDESCRKELHIGALCLYGELAIKFVKTPIFVMSSTWDLYQLTQMITNDLQPITLPPRTKEEISFLASYSNNSQRSVKKLLRNSKNGVFSPACFAHTFFTNCIDGIICEPPRKTVFSSNGQSAYGALSQWFRSNGQKGSYIDSISKEPTCNPSCCTSHCHKCYSITDILKNKATINLFEYKSHNKRKQSDKYNKGGNSNDYYYGNQRVIYYSPAVNINQNRHKYKYIILIAVCQVLIRHIFR